MAYRSLVNATSVLMQLCLLLMHVLVGIAVGIAGQAPRAFAGDSADMFSPSWKAGKVTDAERVARE